MVNQSSKQASNLSFDKKGKLGLEESLIGVRHVRKSFSVVYLIRDGYSSLLSFSLVSPNRHTRTNDNPTNYILYRSTYSFSEGLYVDQRLTNTLYSSLRRLDDLHHQKMSCFVDYYIWLLLEYTSSHVPHTLSFFTFLITFTL